MKEICSISPTIPTSAIIKELDSKIKDIMLSLDLNKSDFKVDEIYPDVFLIEKK